MDIVLFGIQGSGKGTLGKAVTEKFGYRLFETGSELRKLSKDPSPLGQKVKSIVEAGHLVPNEVVMEIIENFMKQVKAEDKVLFDGIPRKLDQADSFEALMKKFGRDFTGILIDVPKEVAIRRLSNRRICPKCKNVYPASYTQADCEKCGEKLITRSDDNPESIKVRVDAFFQETMPVITRYQEQDRMITMNGDLSIEEAQKEIFRIIEKLAS